MLDKLAKRGLTLSMIVGTLLVPLTALAAIWLADPETAEEIPTPSVVDLTSVSTATSPSTTAETRDIAADLEAACGPEGLQLVSLEDSRAITDVQQAALDALREVCLQQGTPLPPKPAPEPTVQTVVVPATATASPAPSSTPTSYDDDHDDDEHEDEHDDEDDDEYEYEYEYEVDD
jgi:hypothetical protein